MNQKLEMWFGPNFLGLEEDDFLEILIVFSRANIQMLECKNNKGQIISFY